MEAHEIMEIPITLREQLNHQAYLDVLDCKDSSNDHPYYKYCYRQWKALMPVADSLSAWGWLR